MPVRNINLAIADIERLSLTVIASSCLLSSTDNHIGIGFFDAIPLGKFERAICFS